MIDVSTIQRQVRRDDDCLDLANLAEVGTFISRVFNKPQAQAPVDEPVADMQGGVGQGGAEQAAEPECAEVDMLLSRAAKAIEYLSSRCQILESELLGKDEELAEYEQASKQWMQFSTKLQAQTVSDQATIAALVARAEAAESRMAASLAAAAEAAGRTVAADERSSTLHGKVVAAFGRKSPIHPLIQALSLQAAAE